MSKYEKAGTPDGRIIHFNPEECTCFENGPNSDPNYDWIYRLPTGEWVHWAPVRSEDDPEHEVITPRMAALWFSNNGLDVPEQLEADLEAQGARRGGIQQLLHLLRGVLQGIGGMGRGSS